MIQIDLDKIVAFEDLPNRLNQVVDDAKSGAIFVITKDDRPAVAIVSIDQLEGLSGRKVVTPLSEPAPIEPPPPPTPEPTLPPSPLPTGPDVSPPTTSVQRDLTPGAQPPSSPPSSPSPSSGASPATPPPAADKPLDEMPL